MKNYKFWQKAAVIICPLLLAVLIYYSAVFAARNFTFPPCLLYELFGIYCPGCGMTRAVIALLQGDVLLSLRQNAFIVLGLIILAIIYIGFVLKVLGIKIMPCKIKVKIIYILLILSAAYAVLRNFIPAIAPI